MNTMLPMTHEETVERKELEEIKEIEIEEFQNEEPSAKPLPPSSPSSSSEKKSSRRLVSCLQSMCAGAFWMGRCLGQTCCSVCGEKAADHTLDALGTVVCAAGGVVGTVASAAGGAVEAVLN
ncbi:hypothetical protein HOP50_16g78060 [Chloropicon primus]|uniref:Uncharacterized protein n=1 Tax=Chloropicon primus TaxID=1764295 RepID=A0A5B8MXD5_9CHLO|nr:hypothetical protein A3770_16p77770 [Chloropicon primus]UPR04464.1 hypothetical protein HOP50_16g78060 [Chloropicon primus]|eukprot:QDZ25259.1 hypothetical protein A3770_16p77770 [Chloropicon primus]